MRVVLVFALLVVAAHASAQPCDECRRGDALIDTFGLAAIRPLAGDIAAVGFAGPLYETQYAGVVALRRAHPILGRLGALDDDQLALVAAALCGNASNACASTTQRALICLADRCEVVLAPSNVDVLIPDPECTPPERKRTPLLGVGVDWGQGVQRAGAANDGRVTSLGLAARVRYSDRLGFVARVDRTDGRDKATDVEPRDGADDFQSRSITRFSALAGPSLVLDSTKFERSTRSVRLDLLGGYVTTRTLPGENGLAVGADLALQLYGLRTGLRFVQGVGDAGNVTMFLAHVGFAVGSTPTHRAEDGCPPKRRSSRLALGFELPFTGGGFSSQLGYMAVGFGTELIWHLLPRVDAIARVDLLTFPRREADRVIHSAALAGFRFDHGKRPRRKRTGWYSTLMAGATHGAVLEPSTAGTGPIVDASIAWGMQDDEIATYLRLHGRFGLSGNEDYRAVFLAFGFEMRFDRQRWADRDRTW